MKSKAALNLRGACLAAGLAFLFSGAQADEPHPLLFIDVNQGSASLIANDVPIRDVLEGIALKTGIIVYSRSSLDERVTYSIKDIPVPEIIRRILKDRNFTLHYLSDAASGQPVFGSRLWILADDDSTSTPVWSVGEPAEKRSLSYSAGNTDNNRLRAVSNIATWENDPANEAELLVAINDPAVSVRAEAVHLLGEINSPQSLEYIKNALHDPERKVRVAAIEALADSGSDGVPVILAALLHDQDQEIRAEVIDAMADIGSDEARQYLYEALSDSNEINRETAAGYIAETATTTTASRF